MVERRRTSLLAAALRGGIGGLVGTWLMDLVTTGLLEAQSEESKRQEDAARPNGKSSVANLVDRAILQQHFHDIKANLNRWIAQQVQVVQSRSRQASPSFAIDRCCGAHPFF